MHILSAQKQNYWALNLSTWREFLLKKTTTSNGLLGWLFQFINDSNLSPPAIKRIELPANGNEAVTKKAYVTATLSSR